MDKANNLRVLLLLATVGVLGYAFYRAQSIDFNALPREQSRLENLRQLEQSIDQNVLKIRAGLPAKGGSLMRLTNRMETLLDRLRVDGHLAESEAAPGLAKLLREYAALVERRQDLLRRFTDRNAAVRDSLQSMPALAATAVRDAGNINADVRRAVQDFQVAILLYHVHSSRESAPEIGLSIQRMRRVTEAAPKPIADLLRAMMRHGEVIVAHRTEADWTLKELLAHNGAALLNTALEIHQRRAETLRATSDSYRLVMFAAAIMLVCYIAVTLTNLVQTRRDLQRANAELEERIVDMSRAKEEAELANRSKSEFLAMMSHELRTPLNAVIGFSDLIRMESFGPMSNARYTDYAQDIHDSANHLLSLINDILDLSKIERGGLKPEDETLDLCTATQAVETLVKERATAGKVKLTIDCAPSLPRLRADPRQFKQMLINLMSNAVKFTEPGGAVFVRITHKDGQGHAVEVHDTGIGMDEDDIPKALKPFVQVDRSLGRQHQGTGLGLPLTARMIEMHGGALELKSELGGGTTARLLFPTNRVASLSAIEKPKADAKPRAAKKPAAKKTVKKKEPQKETAA